MSKYNKTTSAYNEDISLEQYTKENPNGIENSTIFMDEKYMIYKTPDGYIIHMSSKLHPPIYYLIASQVLKIFKIDNITMEYNNERATQVNSFINNKILKENNPTYSLVLILRLFQIIYGLLIIYFIYKIIMLFSEYKFEKKSIFLLSGIAFLPQFLFLCSYINNDILSALFGLLSVYFMILLLKKNKSYFGIIAIIFAIIAGFTKFTILIMIPVSIVVFFIWLIIRKKIWAIATILLFMAFAVSAFFFIINHQSMSFNKSPILDAWNARFGGNNITELLANIKANINLSSFIDNHDLFLTLKSTVASFGWSTIFVDNFIYKYYLAYVLSGIMLLLMNIKNYKENKKSFFFIIASIVSIFLYYLLYTFYDWAWRAGRTIILAVFLTFILAIIGFKNIKVSYRNVIYYSLFSCSLFISVFCLYNYIYLKYY